MRLVLMGIVVVAACSGEPCLQLPCAPPLAMRITVASKPTDINVRATVNVVMPGGDSNLADCQNGSCIVVGGPGKYHLTASATGFVTADTDVTITGSEARKCASCTSVDTRDVKIALTPTG